MLVPKADNAVFIFIHLKKWDTRVMHGSHDRFHAPGINMKNCIENPPVSKNDILTFGSIQNILQEFWGADFNIFQPCVVTILFSNIWSIQRKNLLIPAFNSPVRFNYPAIKLSMLRLASESSYVCHARFNGLIRMTSKKVSLRGSTSRFACCSPRLLSSGFTVSVSSPVWDLLWPCRLTKFVSFHFSKLVGRP